MSRYTIEKRPQACRVDKALLLELESYLEKRLPALVFGGEKYRVEDRGLSVDDPAGVESVNAVAHYSGLRFPNGTSRVVLTIEMETEHRSVEVAITFATTRLFSGLRIRCWAPNAREIALGVHEQLRTIIQDRATLSHWWVWPFDVQWFAGVTLVGLGLLLSAVPEQRARIIGPVLMAVGATLYIVPKLRPYCSFDSAAQDRADAVAKWLATGIGGFIVFGTVLVAIRRKWLGF